jgi:ubiquinone/menaquinone biosynthesis C-methylase UbiE
MVRRRPFLTAFVTALAAASLLQAQGAADIAADAERLLKALDIRTGQIIGELGAGDGQLTVALAKSVGESGRVYSNELSTTSLGKIRTTVATSGLRNVTVVEGAATRTNLPDACCDAIVMRDVYHHISDPSQMNASILRALKPGGRVAIIDFTPPPGGEHPPGSRAEDNHHGITPPTLERELKEAGFELLSTTEIARRNFMVIARRPGS